jgi:hypothetical protein
MTDNDDTPPIRLAVPEHVEPLAARLRREPTAEERSLAQLVDRHDGAEVPFHMFAKVAIMTDGHERWFDRLERAWRRSRRYVMAGVLSAATSLGSLGLYWLHAHDERVAAAAREAAAQVALDEYRHVTSDKIEQLRLDVRELRAALNSALHRLGVADPPGGVTIVQREDRRP